MSARLVRIIGGIGASVLVGLAISLAVAPGESLHDRLVYVAGRAPDTDDVEQLRADQRALAKEVSTILLPTKISEPDDVIAETHEVFLRMTRNFLWHARDDVDRMERAVSRGAYVMAREHRQCAQSDLELARSMLDELLGDCRRIGD